MNQEILGRLDVLAQKLGVTAQYLWTVLVKEARIEAVLDTIIAFLFAGVVTVFLCWLIKAYIPKSMSRDRYPEDWEDGLAVIGGIAALIFACVAIGYFYQATYEWLNPEYAALKMILDAVKSK